MIAVIDNYDSFTYNLVQCLGELGAELNVFRNDQVTLDDLEQLAPSHILISPGPGTPNDGGISNDVIRRFSPRLPILGVCLGHQCIAHVFGAKVSRAPRLMHGKTSLIYHGDNGIFAGLTDPFTATRYHSLIVEKPLPPELELTASTIEGEVMGIRHRRYPTFGVQFHPESILTPEGKQLLNSFLVCAPMLCKAHSNLAFAEEKVGVGLGSRSEPCPPPILPGPEAILITDCECTRFLATGTLGPNEEKGNGNQRSD